MKRILVALVLLVAAVAALHFITENRRSREREEARSRRLLSLNVLQVHGLRLRLAGVDWAMDRTDGGAWHVNRPVRDLADGNAILEFLQLLNRTEAVETIGDPERLQAYGLEPARAEIRVLGVDVPVVHVGNPTPAGNSVFMRVQGRPEVLVVQADADSLYLDPDPNRFRDPSLTGMPATEVRQVALLGKDSLTLAREDGQWWIVDPVRLPASTGVMTRFLETLGAAEIIDFLDGEDPADPRYGLTGRAPTIRLDGADGSTTLRLGAGTDAGVRFAFREDRALVLAVSGEGLYGLPETVDDFLDEKLTKANRYRVRWFRYRKGDRVLELTRDSQREVWMDAAGTERPDDQVFPMLVRLLEGKLEGWRSGKQGTAAAVLEYEDDSGVRDRLVYGADGTAALDSVPGLVFTGRIRLPEIPD